jgi:type VI secretion system secreted protein Hcp
MAVDMFLVLKDVKGETRDKVYGPKNAIDVLAWSFGSSNSGSAHMGGGAGAGKVNVQDISITKYIDKSSPILMQACCKGTHFATAELVVRKAGGKPLEYIKITLTEVLISSISLGGSGGEDRLTENVSLNFAKFKYDYVEQKADGTEGDKPTMTYSIAENAEE